MCASLALKFMKKCTPRGGGELPALPQTELSVVFKQYPAYWKDPAGFETIWERCMNAIEQACKRLRQLIILMYFFS